ncbi:MAG TPA: HEPN domain-containing protein, partial [Pricia sp.]|nr:HEPN domain-containing protein [Pricia sp.]
EALRLVLDDYEANGKGASYGDYYAEKGQKYFYDFLTHLSDTDTLTPEDFIDWGNTERYKTAIGIGECAGVVIDLIATLLFDSEEKIENARESLEHQKWAASIYHAYSSMVNSAKALLTGENVKVNTHVGIISDFDEKFTTPGRIAPVAGWNDFSTMALQIKNTEPTEAFAKSCLKDAKLFLKSVEAFREQELAAV